MRYFTSDMHFGDTRLNLFGRDLVTNSSEEMDNIIITNWNNTIKDEDTVYVLGDVALNKEGLEKVKLLKGTKILIRGNYDQQFSVQELEQYFSEICDDIVIYVNDEPVYLNHYPTNCKANNFNVTAHIHGTWKVQRNMINVGTDAWHFMPISEEMIKFQMNGIRKHYDQNVFAGELLANTAHIRNLAIEKYQLNWIMDGGSSGDKEPFHFFGSWRADNASLKIEGYHGQQLCKATFKIGDKVEIMQQSLKDLEAKFKVKL